MARRHATADAYGRMVSTDEYRRSRVRKAEVIWHLCQDRLSAAERAADLGAGTGIMRAAVERLSGRPLYGFEIDLSFVADRTRMCGADVLRLPLRDGALDFVLMNHLYEHVADPAGLFREAYRVLAPGGAAYVTAGSRTAIMEPHYRLPFLSWLPRPMASAYLRASGRGHAYEGIRFLTWRPLVRMMTEAGFVVNDLTERAIDDLLDRTWGGRWPAAWKAAGHLSSTARERLLRLASPQWFFLLEKPFAGPAAAGTGRSSASSKGREVSG